MESIEHQCTRLLLLRSCCNQFIIECQSQKRKANWILFVVAADAAAICYLFICFYYLLPTFQFFNLKQNRLQFKGLGEGISCESFHFILGVNYERTKSSSNKIPVNCVQKLLVS